MSGKRRRRGETASTPAPAPRARRSDAAIRAPWRAPAVGSLWAVALLLVVVGALVYANSLSGAFVFDDTSAIPNNPSIRTLWPPWTPLLPPAGTAVARRPVVNLSFALNYAADGLNVTGYHVVNVAIHILSCLLLFGIARRTLAAEVVAAAVRRAAPWLALAIALIWLIHPLQTESVDYLVQRTELLMALFFLLTLYSVIRGADSVAPPTWFACAILSCALALACKEVAGVLPLVVLLYDRTFLARSFREALRKRRLLYGGLAATWLILVMTLGERLPTKTELADHSMTPWTYALTQSTAIVRYLRLSFWPSPLTVDYEDWPVATSILSVAPALALVLLLLGVTAWALWRAPALAFPGAAFFLILAPTSSVVPIPTEILAERRMYLPLAAVIALAVVGSHLLLERLRARRGWANRTQHYIEIGVALVLVVVLAGVTIKRNEDYRTADGILADAVAKRPGNWRARSNLGSVLTSQGRSAEALPHYAEAVRLKPDYIDARYNLANALSRAGRFDEAIAQYTETLRLRPQHAEAHNNLGNVLRDRGRVDEAIVHFKESLRIDPGNVEAYNNLGLAFAIQDRLDEAIAQYAQALRLKPDLAEAQNNLGIALARQGKLDEARAHFLEALRLRPNFTEAYGNLGTALATQGRLEEAVAQYEKALRINPSFARAHYDIAMALTRLGKTEQAAQHFDAAAKIDPRLRRP